MSVETGERVSAPKRRRGVSFYLGVGLVLAGLGLLGYVGWQFFGTNIVSRQAQERVVSELEAQWESRPAGSSGQGSVAGTEADLGEASALVRIPRFGDDYVIPVLEGVADDVLAKGYGHFEHSADPGHKGNYALAAHRVTHGEPLRDMPELRPGDEVLVETADAIYTYELETDPNDLVVSFTDVWVVDPLPSNPDPGGVQPEPQEPGRKLITLTTCSEIFHTDNRMIAFGHLVDTERKRGR